MIFSKQQQYVIAGLSISAFFTCALNAQESVLKAASDEKVASQSEITGDALVPPSSNPDEQPTDAGNVQQTADEGIQIQVEKSTGISGLSDEPGALKVYSPWPAKPLAEAPAGWQYLPAPSEIKPYKQSVKLGSGKSLDLSITPFVLEPLSDGVKSIRIQEPGYDPTRHYAQENTVGAMLQKSTLELEENEKHAAKAISLLQQLLSSLPQK